MTVILEEKELINTTEAAKVLGVSKSTIYRMLEHGLIEAIKTPGGQRRFDKLELKKYKANSKNIIAPQNPYISKVSKTDTGEDSLKETNDKSSSIDSRNKLNDLTGREWLPETKSFFFQKGLGAKHAHAQIERLHPAPYSYQDIMRLISFFTKQKQVVLDPFGGVGSTAKACELLNRKCVSIELSEKWHNLAIQRLETEVGIDTALKHDFINDDCIQALRKLSENSVDFMVTSPPYWSILNKKADHKVKANRVNNNLDTNYSFNENDLGNIENYEEFLNILVNDVFIPSAKVLKEGKYMALVVSDFRNKSQFISFHSDLIQKINNQQVDNLYKLSIQGVKVLAQNHKSLLPYGYPFAYVENIHHQYILIFRKERNKK